MWLKVHMNSLFTCHVVSWRRIPLNRVEGKLFPNKKSPTCARVTVLHLYSTASKTIWNSFSELHLNHIEIERRFVKRDGWLVESTWVSSHTSSRFHGSDPILSTGLQLLISFLTKTCGRFGFDLIVVDVLVNLIVNTSSKALSDCSIISYQSLFFILFFSNQIWRNWRKMRLIKIINLGFYIFPLSQSQILYNSK